MKVSNSYFPGSSVSRSSIKSQLGAFQDEAGGEQNISEIPSFGNSIREIGALGENTQVPNLSGSGIMDKGPGEIVTRPPFVPIGPMAQDEDSAIRK